MPEPAAEEVSSRLLSVDNYPLDVIDEISPRDHMYHDNPPAYFRLAKVALRCVQFTLLLTGRPAPETILDLPSGHGRVLRILKAEFPNARLAACDIDRDAVDFCSSVLGATPVYGKPRPQDVEIDGSYDLIWCSSLMTHLDRQGWTEFLDFFESILAPDGILIFTVSSRT